ncbi:MAG: hypothetical protein JSW28_05770 [Thermoplasmata archaeon]|nr:MAG: hypothetical protein JSW28_05770 [Thermoplasmata archaeon]
MGIEENDKRNLERIREAGVTWVRLDVKEPMQSTVDVFKEAHRLDLKVIAVVLSKKMLRGLGFPAGHYLPGSDWKRKWKERVSEAAGELGPYVDIWQVDNELNHPWHNLLPSMNLKLAVEIVDAGAEAIRERCPHAETAANVFFERKVPFSCCGIDIFRDERFILSYKEKLRDAIDILGMDIYRSTWHGKTPQNYPSDLERYHGLWGGDVMIMETGFCTGFLGGSEADQASYVHQVFDSLDHHIRHVPWFRGAVWYKFKSKDAGLPCEGFFGLRRGDGSEEKEAWGKFVERIGQYNRYNKILGIMYHW